MKHPFSHRLPFLLGAVVALTLAALLVQIRYQLEMLRQRSGAQEAIHVAADEVTARLNLIVQREAAAATSSRDWHRWKQTAGGFVPDTVAIPVPESVLQNAFAAVPDRGWRLLGPFATEHSRNVFVVRAFVSGAGRTAVDGGDWMYADDLIPGALLTWWLKNDYRIRIFDDSAHAALYQSDEGAVDAPVAAPIGFGSSRLSLGASPRHGWRIPPGYLSSCLLVSVAVAAWLGQELRRAQTLRNAVSDAEQAEVRRREVNVLYGEALRSVAALESRLQMVNSYDSLTGLANRASLLRRIEQVLHTIRQGSQTVLGVMAIGFDHMHHIANSFGAEFATRVLVVAAERVEFVLRSKDAMFRTGDYSLAVVPTPGESGSCEKLAQQLVAEIEAPISLDSHTFMLHPSVGVAESRSGYDDAESILDKASAALGAVPQDAPIRYCLFDSASAKESASRLRLEADLGDAFEENQFFLEYEPLVLPVTLEVMGFEALIRWDHPTEGRINPGRFVPIAARAGMSHRLNAWVMREAARQASIWHHAGHVNLFVNFNLSAEAFLRPDLASEVAELLAEFDLPGRNLILELTESTLIQDVRAAARTLAQLEELQVGAWLDDFGSGYSSLSYLRALPMKGVKIDRSFVERTVIDARDFGFLKSMIDLISYLGMQSVAQGIETREQYDLLSLTACNLYQGYHFAQSMRAPEAERWLQRAVEPARRRVPA